MPCNSDYMQQTGKEARLQETAQLLIYLLKRIGDAVPKKYQQADTYYSTDVGQTAALCKLIRSLNEDEINTYVYDARNRDARRLADWWEEHVAADEAREAKEADERKRQELIKLARAKLTDEEFEAVKRNY